MSLTGSVIPAQEASIITSNQNGKKCTDACKGKKQVKSQVSHLLCIKFSLMNKDTGYSVADWQRRTSPRY